MKKNLNLLAFAFLLLSCQKGMVDRQESTEIKASSTKTSGSARYTYLTVTVDDADGNKIKSDGKGIYQHGVDNVRAEFQHSSGEFYMMTNTLTSKMALRRFAFPENELSLEGKNDYRIRIKDEDDNTDGETNLQEMNAGATDDKMVMRLWSFDSKGNKLFDIIFNPDISEGEGSSYVTVKKIHTLGGEEFWEVSPNGNAVILMANGDKKIEPMPFKFTLKRK